MNLASKVSGRLEDLVKAIEDNEALDRPADALAGVVSKLIRPSSVTDALSGTWLGHPVHPFLVALPVGAWTGAAALDLSSVDTPRASRRLIGFGLLTALPAIATGASDWTFTDKGERRVGFIHALANTAALSCYAASWLARRRGTSGPAIVTSLAGAGLLSVGGYLGGHLAYAAGVGVDTTAFSGGPQEWTPMCPATDIPEGGLLSRQAGKTSLVLTKEGDTIAALANRCTHRGAPLADGERRDGCVVCPWHASSFRLVDGAVVRGPATRAQPVYETRVVDGIAEARRAESRALRTEPVGP